MLRKRLFGGIMASFLTIFSVFSPIMVIINTYPIQKIQPLAKLNSKKTETAPTDPKRKTQPPLEYKQPVDTKSETTVSNQPVAVPTVVATVSTKTIATKSAKTLSNYQFEMLVRIISAEAKGEPLEGQVAVGAVILNRVASDKFPETVAANVLKRGEFEPVSNGHIWRTPSASAYKAARLAINGWDPTYGALYFYNPAKSTSRWIWSRRTITKIGDHVFAA